MKNTKFNSIIITRDQNYDFNQPMSLIQFTIFNHNENSIKLVIAYFRSAELQVQNPLSKHNNLLIN